LQPFNKACPGICEAKPERMLNRRLIRLEVIDGCFTDAFLKALRQQKKGRRAEDANDRVTKSPRNNSYFQQIE